MCFLLCFTKLLSNYVNNYMYIFQKFIKKTHCTYGYYQVASARLYHFFSSSNFCFYLHLQLLSMGRRKFGTDFQLMFRIVKALLFFGFVTIMTILFLVCGLSISDIFAALLAFTPTGWAFLLVSLQFC